MDSTSNRTEINLDSNGDEITFEGWTLLDKQVYDLWLSPCKTYLVQHYDHTDRDTNRMMKSAYNQDVYMQDCHLRKINRMGQIIALKNWEHMVVHEFTGCYWYGEDSLPEDYPQLLADLKTAEIAWPTITRKNLYRNPEGELRVIGPNLCFEYIANPINLNFWGQLLTTEQQHQANSLPKVEGNAVDWRAWEELRDRNA